MSRCLKDFFCIPLYLLLVVAPSGAWAWPTVHHAPGMDIEWVADRMVYNGVPMKVENFSCDCEAEEVLEYYRQRWDREHRETVENDLGEFSQIAYGDRRYFVAVMVRPDPRDWSSSVGRITVSEMPEEGRHDVVLGEGVPKAVPDTQVINDIHDAMPGKRSRTVLMINHLSVEDNTRFYHSYYSNMGWKSYLRTIDPELGVQAISYSHKNRDANVVIHEEGGNSHILFNEVEEVMW